MVPKVMTVWQHGAQVPRSPGPQVQGPTGDEGVRRGQGDIGQGAQGNQGASGDKCQVPGNRLVIPSPQGAKVPGNTGQGDFHAQGPKEI